MKFLVGFVALWAISATLFSTELCDKSIALNQICSPTECYTIINKLGEGAFGEVFEVVDSQDQKFALKTYKTCENLEFMSQLLADAQREYSYGQLLNHPGIIRSYDLFELDTSVLGTSNNLILEFVEGQTLNNTARGSFKTDKAVQSVAVLCEALEYAFSFGLLYLDLHGGNMMINTDMDIKVIDLASFCTFDEIIQAFYNISTEEHDNKSSSTLKQSSLVTKEFLNNKTHVNAREIKIRKSLVEKPKLLRRLQKVMAEKQIKKNGGQVSSFSLCSRNKIDDEKYQRIISQNYFEDITNICMRFIDKSDLERELKIDLKAEMKKIVWNYEEDVLDGCTNAMEHYFEELKSLLRNH